MSSKRKAKTVSEKIIEAIEAENKFDSTDESADEATAPRVEFYDEYDTTTAVGLSNIRKQNVKVLSEQSARYRGKIAKRKDLENPSTEEENSSDDDTNLSGLQSDDDDEAPTYEESDTDEEQSEGKVHLAADSDAEEVNQESSNVEYQKEQTQGMELLFNSDDDNSNDNNESDYDEDDDDDDVDDDNDSVEEELDDADVMPKTDNQEQLRKGAAVQNQLKIWEKLLEMRIGMQKALSNANKLPAPENLKAARDENEELKLLMLSLEKGTSELLQKQLELKMALTKQSKEMCAALELGKRTLTLEQDNEEDQNEPPTKKYATCLTENFANFHDYRDAVLIKWDDRTRLLAPSGKKKASEPEFDIIKKLNNAKSDMPALIQRSQTPKNAAQTADTTNVNIYDDSDFYHQLLRELIDYKTESSSDMNEVSRQFMELQKMRQRMKKIVDTRASKGRKLRYCVHKKLVNFMAPETTGWAEIPNGFFKSLFV